MTWLQWIVISLFTLSLWWLWGRVRRRQQLAFIDSYRLNTAVVKKFRQRHPQLDDAQVEDVLEGLKDYFTVCHHARRRRVSMPSQVVDDAWHEFILFTRLYQHYCRKAFGRFMHHTPAEAMADPRQAHDGIKRAWRISCALAQINPKAPERLPRLFALDRDLNIPNGFYYAPNCRDKRQNRDNRADYCGSSMGCSSGCMGDSGGSSDSSFFGDSDSSSGCSSGCGGGD